MARARTSHGFTALRIEGGILPPEFLQIVAGLRAPHQDAPDYGLSKSIALKEELARYWHIAGDLHASLAERRLRNDLSNHRVFVDEWLAPLLRDVLGYGDLTPCVPVELGDRVFKLSHLTLDDTVPCLLTHDGHDLDRAADAFAEDGRRQAPHALMQEYLNANDGCLWGIVSNGSKLRLLRDNASMTRPAYIEADLDLIFAEQLYPDFAALWFAAHASRLASTDGKPSSCIVEGWRAEAMETGERVLGHLRDGVAKALLQLGGGFLSHPENQTIRAALRDGALTPDGYFQQLLRLVYRMLFLFATEERDLLLAPDSEPEQRQVYADGYSISRLRERALRRRHYDRHTDLWQGLTITFAALGTGAPGLGLPALGGLFRPDQCPDLDPAAIANEDLLDAVRSLAFFRNASTLAQVNYRDMGTEELGSVYESLLELQPVLDVDAEPWSFRFAGVGAGGSERKLTGSYYTPPPLVNELVKSALDPVLADTIDRHPENPRKAILDLRVVDPACGSGHFLLAAARRMAAEVARIDAAPHAPDEPTRQHALRDVVRHCVHGVDRNPLAVELCRTALWIETVEPGKPLTFLDAHIQLGDSLVGVLDPAIMADGIPADAYKPLTGDDKAACRVLRKRNKDASAAGQTSLFDDETVLEVAITGADLDAMQEDTLDDIEQKSAAWRAALEDEARAREELKADLYVGAFFADKSKDAALRVPSSDDLGRVSAGMARETVVANVRELAVRHRFFHWHLAFAEVMQNGGFDVVLGNPPWDQVQLDPREFFAFRSPEIAQQPTMAARNTAIEALSGTNPALYTEYRAALVTMERIQNFIHRSDRFPKTSHGRLNSAPLFAEQARQLVGPRGRVGVVVPTGIATDSFNQYFFASLVEDQQIASLYDFENREAVFSGVHRSYKFCLLTLTGSEIPCQRAEFAFFLHQVDQLGEAERRFALSADDFGLFNPNTRTCPIFRTQRDMEIARRIYLRAGTLWRDARNGMPEENPWGVSFQLMFMMNTDSGEFRTRDELVAADWKLYGNAFSNKDGERYLPLYEAKLFHQYDHRFATFDDVPSNALKNGNARPMSPSEKANPDAVVLPRYWVPEAEVQKRLDKSEPGLNIPTERPNDRTTERPNDRTTERPNDRTTERRWSDSPNWRATRSQRCGQVHRRTNRDRGDDSPSRPRSYRLFANRWLHCFRNIARATDRRTSLGAIIATTAMNEGGPILGVRQGRWLHALRDVTNATNARSVIGVPLPESGVGHTSTLLDFERTRAVAASLVLANMNSLPFDWATRLSVGGTHLSQFIVKQLPVLPPEAYVQDSLVGGEHILWVQLIVPKVIELTYTANDLSGFAEDIGYDGPPFPWDPERRHRLQCELDAIYAHMYGLDRDELEWMLDAPHPGASFPTLKRNEIDAFGEYRTQRYVLEAYDQLAQGQRPDLSVNA